MSFTIYFKGRKTGDTGEDLEEMLRLADELNRGLGGRGHEVHADDIDEHGRTLLTWEDLDDEVSA